MNAAIMIGFVALAAVMQPAMGQDGTRETAIVLPEHGKTSSYEGKIRGYGGADYVFKAPAGRKLRIDLKTKSTSTYFNLARDGKDEALFVGSVSGNIFEAALPEDGAYRIKVYQMRNAARKGATARYALHIR